MISELRKRDRGSPRVARWVGSVDPAQLHTSVLVIGEIRRGIELKRRRDPNQAAALEIWLGAVRTRLAGRILSVNERITDMWGTLGIPDAIAAVDGLLAATAIVHGLTLVTRNIADLSRTAASLMNPFEY